MLIVSSLRYSFSVSLFPFCGFLISFLPCVVGRLESNYGFHSFHFLWQLVPRSRDSHSVEIVSYFVLSRLLVQSFYFLDLSAVYTRRVSSRGSRFFTASHVKPFTLLHVIDAFQGLECFNQVPSNSSSFQCRQIRFP